MKLFFKFILKHLVRIFLHFFWLFPVNKKKIYFIVFRGTRFSCNPKYLYNYIVEKFGQEYSYVWEFKKEEKGSLVPCARTVRSKSFRALIEILTSRFIITNNDFYWWIPIRKKQVLLQTWHGGGAYKKVGVDEKWNSIFIKEQMLLAKNITYYVSSSAKFTEVQSGSKNVPIEKFIKTGMPRNAIFFDYEKMNCLRKKVFDLYGLDNERKVILYAPTFRGKPSWKLSNSQRDYGCLNFESIKKTVEERFGAGFLVLYRAHHLDSRLENYLPSFAIDASQYEDMQELLCAADVLITDYSSTMWDFALTKKPCFLYAPDLQRYASRRGFYTDPKTWPFPLAETEEQLALNIKNFDEAKYKVAVQKHLDDFGSYENKDACEKICKAIGLEV